MPRGARAQSESSIYHVMLRGINQVQLFYEDDDRHAFLERLGRYVGEGAFIIYAYVLMGNHVHLLLKEGSDSLSRSMKRLALSYSHYFNAKYDRSGYLFQGRFRSEPVDSDAYLLAVVRYIHHNPVKVGESIGHWTSYSEYLDAPVVIDDSFVLNMFSDDKETARSQLKELLLCPDGDELEVSLAGNTRKLSDREAIEIINAVAGTASCNELAGFEKDLRNQVLRQLKDEGLSIRQISRLTEIGKAIVHKA